MTKEQFYQILIDAVKHSPYSSYNSKIRLETFAVLRTQQDLNTSNLDKSVLYRDKKYFFSQAWNAKGKTANSVTVRFPALIVFETTPYLVRPFEYQSEICTNLQVAIVYPNIEKAETDTYKKLCTKLVPEEIYAMCTEFFDYVTEYVKAAKYYNITSANGYTNQFYHPGFISFLSSEGQITSATPDVKETNYKNKRMEINNPQPNGSFIDDIGIHKLCGVQFPITVCKPGCTTYTPNFNIDCC